MKNSRNRWAPCFLVFSLVCCAVGAAPSGEVLQQGLYAEEIEGDLPAAIASYEKVINDPSAAEKQVAQALYHQGMCYVRLQDDAKAVVALTRLVTDYSSQTNLVEKARPVLDNLQFFDPAALMPPDTMAYIELGNPGQQIETLLEMLKDTPYENPLTMFDQLSAGGTQPPGNPLFSFFNPSMLVELKKIRSYAVGLTDVTTGQSPCVFVLHPGDSDALRGMILAGLRMKGAPEEPIEGMSTLLVQDQISAAYDDKIIIIAYPREQLAWCIKQYKGGGAEPSLATGNSSFTKLDKVNRNQNALTVWLNTDDLYARGQQLPNPPGRKIQEINAVLNLASIDDLIVSLAIKPDGLNLDGMARFKEGVPNMIYELTRTPKAGSVALKAVPPDAFYLMGFSLAGGAGSLQAVQLRTLIQAKMGVDIGLQTLEGVEQVALFALPTKGDTAPGEMSFRPGVAIACSNPEQVVQALGQMLATASPGERYSIKQAAGGVVLLSTDQAVIDACTSALLGNASVLDDGPLSGHVESILPESNKIVLIKGVGLLRLIGQRIQWLELGEEKGRECVANYELLAEQFSGTTLAVFTDEQQQSLSLKVRLSGIPPLSQVLGPLATVQKSIKEMKNLQIQGESALWDARINRLHTKPAAMVVNCTIPPVIDGRMDEVWTGAEAYALTNTIYDVNPDSDYEISANYRMLWDADKLYVLIDVTDSSPVNDPSDGWQFSDGIEFYLDVIDREGLNYGFGLVWDEDPSKVRVVQSHGRQIEAMSTAMKNTEKGYCFEVSFPWSELGATVEPGTLIGVEVQVNDNRGRGHRDAKISWYDLNDKSWLSPSYFGRAELLASKAEQE